jgi:putative PIN family toxin of toxin-antitoxin system
MTRKYVVIDTNVLVSALITRNESSPTVQILHFLASGNIIPVYSDEIVKEYNEVLRRAKFKLPESIIINLLKDIMDNGLKVTEFAQVKEAMPDPKDVVFYAVTLSSQDKNSLLVTGNSKHFPEKPFVVTPSELVEILKSNN